MKNLTLLFSLGIFLVLFSCAPRMTVIKITDDYRPMEVYQPFAVIEMEEEFNEPEAIKVGQVNIRDNVLSLSCDYTTIRNLAIDEAKILGGNCIRITNKRFPNSRWQCPRITADVYYLKSPERYESEIFWHKNRKLRISDFKGSAERKPYIAMTAGMIRYYILGKSDINISIETVFDCQDSYFKHTEEDSLTLAHEQIHFDIAELFARKFAERLQHQVNSYQMLLAKHEMIYMEVFRELQSKQEEYDMEVYNDPSKLPEWREWVDIQLERFQEYEDKEFYLNL